MRPFEGGYFVFLRWPDLTLIVAGDGTYVNCAGFSLGMLDGRDHPAFATCELATERLRADKPGMFNIIEAGVCTREEAVAMSNSERARRALEG